MRRTLTFVLLGAIVALISNPIAALASPGSPVVIRSEFLVFDPLTVLTTTSHPSGVLCPVGMSSGPADALLPDRAGPQGRGSATAFVGTIQRVVHCQGEGWSPSDSFVVRMTIKGNDDGLTADGTWTIVGSSGRLAGLHGGGTLEATLAFFPLVVEEYVGTVARDPG